MLVRRYVRQVIHGEKKYVQTRAIVQCDHCGNEYDRQAKNLGVRHFCNRKCQSDSQRSGLLKIVKEQTFLDRFGVTVPAKSPEIKQKTIETNLKRRGVAWPTQDSNVIEKQRITNMKRYGVPNVANQPSVKLKANSPEACAKRHATLKRNGSYKKSEPEDRLYEFLCDRFGDVQRQIPVEDKRWLIDFYIKSIDTYVQLDGIYWHGLNRSIDELTNYRTQRDIAIHKKWLTDRQQDAWFKENNLRLVRITDREFRTMTKEKLLEVLK